jgi:hypothetical protein
VRFCCRRWRRRRRRCWVAERSSALTRGQSCRMRTPLAPRCAHARTSCHKPARVCVTATCCFAVPLARRIGSTHISCRTTMRTRS